MFEKFVTILQRHFLARHPAEKQLYPPLQEKVVFRLYRPDDYNACIDLYRRVEPGRFPKDATILFENYLKEERKTFIIAELNGNVVGCGGINLAGPEVAVLCFGFVAPEWQGKRIGTTLALLRLAQLPWSQKGYQIFIFAVEKSIPFYKRFGFVELGHWATNKDVGCPLAVAPLPNRTLTEIKLALHQRGIQLPESVTVSPSEDMTCEVVPDSRGMVQFKWQKKTDS